ncbi:hypothetical protein [Parvularcula sp. LCG005]|uniref:hypothetical protein n=1 Tax=Parvularcula sp. LCG005 TaxID=3078805 RepID=UPI002942219F|nr:hypothetical protein [Parvularcula sp. LCG005]WOI54277.1 hypothetical protein RUI03_04575 [Parvularcula sp. LCG005]
MDVSLVSMINPESHITITWFPNSGQMIPAKVIGSGLVDFAKLMNAIAREHGGSTTTFLEKISTNEDGCITADFVVLENKKKAKG